MNRFATIDALVKYFRPPFPPPCLLVPPVPVAGDALGRQLINVRIGSHQVIFFEAADAADVRSVLFTSDVADDVLTQALKNIQHATT